MLLGKTDAKPVREAPSGQIESLLLSCVSPEYLRHHRVCPLRINDAGAIVIATAQESYREAIDELGRAYSRPVVEEVTTSFAIEELIDRLCAANGDNSAFRVSSEDTDSDVRDSANQPPVVRYVNALMRDAHASGASDIHLDASRAGVAARYRVDGVLVRAPDPPPRLHHAVVSRIKLLADLDIAERRMPQDGRLRIHVESRELDMRVSTAPTMFGESVVLRLLERGGRPVDLDGLGMRPETLVAMRTLASRSHGMILVTGPTGSGKTTTLYAALQQRRTDVEKIITVEDPVEYQLAGVTQIPVRHDAGVSFGAALRSILRQDPDVIMIGEMRDFETAEIAIQAAMTGHLVFSTLHTNDAIGAIPRLIDLGIQPYLLASTVSGVIAQRLVRMNCDNCSVPYQPDRALLAEFGSDHRASIHDAAFFHGTGCTSCRGTGFNGRIGLFELITVDDSLRDAIVGYATRSEFRRVAIAAGLTTMRAEGWSLACTGKTTVEEVLRVTEE